MYPQCDWLGLLACIPDTRLCYNRPFPVSGLGQCSFLLLSRPAQLPAQIRLLKENRRLPPALHFFAVPLSLSLPFYIAAAASPFSSPYSLCLCRDGNNPLFSTDWKSCVSTLGADTKWLPGNNKTGSGGSLVAGPSLQLSNVGGHRYFNHSLCRKPLFWGCWWQRHTPLSLLTYINTKCFFIKKKKKIFLYILIVHQYNMSYVERKILTVSYIR